jgi:DNA-binding CsgD family transcriptional regulator
VKTPSTHLDDGLILLDVSSLKPVAFTRGAAAVLNPEEESRSGRTVCAIPDDVMRTIRNAKFSELTTLRMPFRIGNDKYVCRAYPLEYLEASSGRPLVVLHLYRGNSSSEAVDALAAAYDLTQREQEALLGISAGLTGKEIAQRMQISPNTVKAYLRLIMVKMGVTRRAGIMGKLLEQTTGGRDAADRNSARPGYNGAVNNGLRGGVRNGTGHR